mmetsp:Transcript_10537/g.31728  ORF Transcript_10537/g.31728 Transcript_10537/m.31728 type:complete len:339 (+) Transcript_10537:2656-3672(+)
MPPQRSQRAVVTAAAPVPEGHWKAAHRGSSTKAGAPSEREGGSSRTRYGRLMPRPLRGPVAGSSRRCSQEILGAGTSASMPGWSARKRLLMRSMVSVDMSMKPMTTTVATEASSSDMRTQAMPMPTAWKPRMDAWKATPSGHQKSLRSCRTASRTASLPPRNGKPLALITRNVPTTVTSEAEQIVIAQPTLKSSACADAGGCTSTAASMQNVAMMASMPAMTVRRSQSHFSSRSWISSSPRDACRRSASTLAASMAVPAARPANHEPAAAGLRQRVLLLLLRPQAFARSWCIFKHPRVGARSLALERRCVCAGGATPGMALSGCPSRGWHPGPKEATI